MDRLREKKKPSRSVLPFVLAVAAGAAGVGGGCGSNGQTSATASGSSSSGDVSTSSSTTTSSSGSGGSGGATSSSSGMGGMTSSSTGGTSTGGGGMGMGGMGPVACTKTASKATRSSAIAINEDDSLVVVANRDVGTVSVIGVTYDKDGVPVMSVTKEINVCKNAADTTCEPWSVAIDACSNQAYVVTRKDQELVEITNLTTGPVKGRTVATGSEPTGLAITPNNTQIFVANWVEGTLSDVDTGMMKVASTVDLNAVIQMAGSLPPGQPVRPALAHPRALAITNNGDGNDLDETVYVTEWYAQRQSAESIANADTSFSGLLYKVGIGGLAGSAILLPPVTDTGFVDHTNATTGCFPNQVGTISIVGQIAYIGSTCASPKGPLGVFNGPATCAVDADCGVVGGQCNLATSKCKPNTTDVKTTTHPVITTVDLQAAFAVDTKVLDHEFTSNGHTSTRMPLLPTDIGFVNNFGYLTAEGADAVFRFTSDAMTGAIKSVGSQVNEFIDLRKDANDKLIRLPVGIATGHGKAFGFVSNDGSRDVTALEFSAQAIATAPGMMDYRIAQATALPAKAADQAVLRGKRFFNTGLGRWSLNSAAWGSCGACHIDGLSDNVTWYFGRGPRQTVSLDGSFASNDATDQRIFNWTGIFDEVADFEGNVRGVSGGLGAIVDMNNARIDLAAESPSQVGLQGSAADIADPMSPNANHPHSSVGDWKDILAYVQAIRSPRRPVGLDANDVAAGKAIFQDPAQGNCVGCHSGAKWTISQRFVVPDDSHNPNDGVTTAPSVEGVDWSVAATAAGFPTQLFPVAGGNPARDRVGTQPGSEQYQCALRPVGTITVTGGVVTGVSPIAVNVLELRQDMKTAGQGAADTGKGFNPPSLLGTQVGAPFFHAGNARSLEESLSQIFQGHYQTPISQVFAPDATIIRQLTAYMLSIDEDEPTVAIPALGKTGGQLCQ